MVKSKRRNWSSVDACAAYLRNHYDMNVRAKKNINGGCTVTMDGEEITFDTYASAFDYLFDISMEKVRGAN